jgi:hypothetical protein
MSAPDSGPYKGTGADGSRTRAPARRQGPLVQVPSGPLVQSDATGRPPRVEFGEAIEAVAQRLGLDPVTFEGPCPLPGHTGTARLASGIPEDPTGDVRLLCCRKRWRSLGEVRAAIGYGFDNARRTNIELATWTRRLACEVGAFRPVAVPLPPLASGASPGIERAREGFGLLAGLRWADGPRRPVPFTVRFAVAWCGLSHGAAQKALRALVSEGIIREVERRGRLSLYLPGPMPEDAEPEARPADEEDALVAGIIEGFDATELPADSSEETGR